MCSPNDGTRTYSAASTSEVYSPPDLQLSRRPGHPPALPWRARAAVPGMPGNPWVAAVTPTAASLAGRPVTAPMLTSPARSANNTGEGTPRSERLPLPSLGRTFAPPGGIAGACEVHSPAADNIHRRRPAGSGGSRELIELPGESAGACRTGRSCSELTERAAGMLDSALAIGDSQGIADAVVNLADALIKQAEADGRIGRPYRPCTGPP